MLVCTKKSWIILKVFDMHAFWSSADPHHALLFFLFLMMALLVIAHALTCLVIKSAGWDYLIISLCFS